MFKNVIYAILYLRISLNINTKFEKRLSSGKYSVHLSEPRT